MHPDCPATAPHAHGPRLSARLIGMALCLSMSLALPATALAQGQMRETLGAGMDSAQPGARHDADEDDEKEDASSDSAWPQAADASADTDPDGENMKAGQGSQPGPGNQLDPQDRIVPSLLREKTRQYDQLSNIWNKRTVPSGLAANAGKASARDSGINSVALSAENVNFYLADGVGYHVKHLKAALVPVNKGEPVDFDDPEQYRIHILSGEVLIRPQDLDALFNNYILTYEPRALASVENHTRKDTLEVTVGARLFKFIPPVGGIPTTLSGPVKVGKDNWLVYTPSTVKQLGLPVKPLLDAAQMSLSTVTPFDRPGVKLEGDQLLMNPETLFPPPRLIIDRISKASLDDDGLTLTFASDTSDAGFTDPPHPADSYIWLQSGDARFFSTLLVNAHLELLSDSDAPLDFHLYHYRAQSAAGTIRSDRDGTLIVRVPNQFEQDDDAPKQNAGLTRRKPGS
ncbi:hypothetical protein [Salinisphaera aquimarina]|uniref:DUF2993 domain-containing protein n=1 Tax=Salinisphaera aquimarina TaxID=2094031 RepID=A0ABV7EM39_9GAMM